MSELNSYHDPPVHGFIQIIGTVGCHDDEAIVSARWRRRGGRGEDEEKKEERREREEGERGEGEREGERERGEDEGGGGGREDEEGERREGERERGREEGGYLSISVSSMLTSWLPRSRDSKMASHSSKKRIASLILASRKMNLKFSPAEKLPSEGKLMRRT